MSSDQKHLSFSFKTGEVTQVASPDTAPVIEVVDPVSASRINDRNSVRVIRKILLAMLSGGSVDPSLVESLAEYERQAIASSDFDVKANKPTKKSKAK